MNHDLLYTWLGLADKQWPPDPYLLLGVLPGEKDAACIEQCVQERLCQLRGYQVSHPEEATEGMNRLAQAFIDVTDCLSREMCNKAMPVTVATANLPRTVSYGASPPPKKRSAIRDDTVVSGKTKVDWKNTPPPVRSPSILETVNGSVANIAETLSDVRGGVAPIAPFETAALEPLTVCPPADPAFELARNSTAARKGLRTVAELRNRVRQTRKLTITWNRLGKYLRDPERRLAKTSEETDLARWMDYLFDLMEDYPAFVGHPGLPGYRVAAMARLEKTAHMVMELDKTQREELARDWEAGEKVLSEHRRYLLEQVKAMRRQGWAERMATEAAGFARTHIVWVIVILSAIFAALLYFNLR